MDPTIVDGVAEFVGQPGVGAVIGVIVGAVLTFALGFLREERSFRRQAKLEDRRFWREHGQDTYIRLMRMCRKTEIAVAQILRGMEHPQEDPQGWLEVGYPKERDEILDELFMYAPGPIIRKTLHLCGAGDDWAELEIRIFELQRVVRHQVGADRRRVEHRFVGLMMLRGVYLGRALDGVKELAGLVRGRLARPDQNGG